ncbi:22555_t:CDS:2, partial [Gigaspora rosea]
NFWDIKETGLRIRAIFEPEIFQKAASGLKNLSSKGRKAKWFRSIEQAILLNMTTQEIKPNFRVIYPNFLSLVPSKIKISKNNRKKKWVIAEETENKQDVRQIIAKRKTKILTEHWASDQVLCSKWSKRTSVIGVLTNLSTQKEKKELPCPITAFDSKDILAEQASFQRETRIDNHIEILNPADFKFIKSQQFSADLELNQRRPDNYSNAFCISYSSEQSKLEKEDRSLLMKVALKNIVFGLSIEKERQMRMNIIKGLIPQDISDNISNKIGLAKKTAQVIKTLMHIA